MKKRKAKQESLASSSTEADISQFSESEEDSLPPERSGLKKLLFGEEKPDVNELEAGSTTVLDILSPTSVDTKSRDYIVVDGVFHAYLYIRRCSTAAECGMWPTLGRALKSRTAPSIPVCISRML